MSLYLVLVKLVLHGLSRLIQSVLDVVPGFILDFVLTHIALPALPALQVLNALLRCGRYHLAACCIDSDTCPLATYVANGSCGVALSRKR